MSPGFLTFNQLSVFGHYVDDIMVRPPESRPTQCPECVRDVAEAQIDRLVEARRTRYALLQIRQETRDVATVEVAQDKHSLVN